MYKRKNPFSFLYWKVFQRRTDGNTDFYKNWDTYRYGFGSFDADFWLGNEQLHYLTNQKNYKLRVDLVTSGGSSKYDEYALFRINDNENKFRLENLGSQSGTAGLYWINDPYIYSKSSIYTFFCFEMQTAFRKEKNIYSSWTCILLFTALLGLLRSFK